MIIYTALLLLALLYEVARSAPLTVISTIPWSGQTNVTFDAMYITIAFDQSIEKNPDMFVNLFNYQFTAKRVTDLSTVTCGSSQSACSVSGTSPLLSSADLVSRTGLVVSCVMGTQHANPPPPRYLLCCVGYNSG
jgi:hypothetical protein